MEKSHECKCKWKKYKNLVRIIFTKNAAKGRKILLGMLQADGSTVWAQPERLNGARKFLMMPAPDYSVFYAQTYEWNGSSFAGWKGFFFVFNGKATVVNQETAKIIAKRNSLPDIPKTERVLPDFIDIY